jgi:hypothetical protein
MPFYENGDVRIHYKETGSGFPFLVIPGGGLNSTIAGLATHPFNPFDEFRGSFALSRPICATPKMTNPPVRLRLIGRGTPIPTTTSA